MEAVEQALARLQEEIDSFHQGTKQQPKEGTADWFYLRAITVGSSYLKRIGQLGCHHDAAACERVYRKASQHFKAADVPPAPVVVRETLPDGSLPSGAIP